MAAEDLEAINEIVERLSLGQDKAKAADLTVVEPALASDPKGSFDQRRVR